MKAYMLAVALIGAVMTMTACGGEKEETLGSKVDAATEKINGQLKDIEKDLTKKKEELAEAKDDKKADLEKEIKKLEEKRDDLKDDLDKALSDAKAKAGEAVDDAKKSLDSTINSLKKSD